MPLAHPFASRAHLLPSDRVIPPTVMSSSYTVLAGEGNARALSLPCPTHTNLLELRMLIRSPFARRWVDLPSFEFPSSRYRLVFEGVYKWTLTLYAGLPGEAIDTAGALIAKGEASARNPAHTRSRFYAGVFALTKRQALQAYGDALGREYCTDANGRRVRLSAIDKHIDPALTRDI